MDFISTALITLKQPTGMWESILNAFKNGTGSYIVAVILIALLVRIVFTLVDIINKKVNMKNADINAKMKPEIDAIQKKYGHDQRLVQQKTSEIYKKYQFSMMGSCFPMLIAMVLQFTVFLTLWNSLQAVSNYNIAEKYENMKNVYANIIVLNDEQPDNIPLNLLKTELTELKSQNKNFELSTDIDLKNNKFTIFLSVENGELQPFGDFDYIADFSSENKTSNQAILEYISKYVIVPTPEEEPETSSLEEEPAPEEPVAPVMPDYVDTGYNEIFKSLAEEAAEQYYIDTQEGFLWIKNIYKAESPSSPLFTKAEIKTYLSNFYTEDEKALEKSQDYEGKIFDNVVAGVDTKALGSNGYYILTILAVVTAFLSTWLSNKLMQKKDQPAPQKSGKMMYIIMPLIIGIFTFMYTSLFAIYLIVGQIVMIGLTPLTTWIVRKWNEADDKKKKAKDEIVVDYRRKD